MGGRFSADTADAASVKLLRLLFMRRPRLVERRAIALPTASSNGSRRLPAIPPRFEWFSGADFLIFCDLNPFDAAGAVA